jgi:hypothetical protein
VIRRRNQSIINTHVIEQNVNGCITNSGTDFSPFLFADDCVFLAKGCVQGKNEKSNFGVMASHFLLLIGYRDA